MTNRTLLARSKIPLYLQVAAQFRLRIENGMWSPGQQVPVLEALQAEFGLARVTIRQALEVLEQEGLIRRHRGRGTFVTEHLPARQEHVLPASWEQLVASLHPVKLSVLAGPRQVAAITPSPHFPLSEGFVPCHVRRLHSIGSAPYCLIDIYIDKDLFYSNEKKFMSQPMILVLNDDHRGLVHEVRQVVTFSISDDVTSEALNITLGEPVVKIERHIADSRGNTVLYSRAQFSGVYVRIEQNLSPATR